MLFTQRQSAEVNGFIDTKHKLEEERRDGESDREVERQTDRVHESYEWYTIAKTRREVPKEKKREVGKEMKKREGQIQGGRRREIDYSRKLL